MTRTSLLARAVLVTFITAAPAMSQDLAGEIGGALDTLGATFEPGETAAFTTMLAESQVSGDIFGHLLYTRRHFDRAAWFFGTDALGDLSDPASLSNFSAMLVETYADSPSAAPADWLETAYAASVAAAALSPDEAAVQNALGNAARLSGHTDEAVAAARRATELAPDEPLYWSNLARALEAAGDLDGAAEALAQAHALEPNGMPVLETVAALPDIMPAYTAAIGPSCTVDFKCQQICPKSIIGGINSVTCEMENSSAQMACSAGEPYPTSYDCNEELPDYGILIPGLNAGFSVAVPGFSVHVLVQGDGTLDIRVEAGGTLAGPVSGYLRADGHFSPSNGASFDNVGGGVRVNVLPNSPANKAASGVGQTPLHVEAETLDGKPVKVAGEAYGVGFLSL